MYHAPPCGAIFHGFWPRFVEWHHGYYHGSSGWQREFMVARYAWSTKVFQSRPWYLMVDHCLEMMSYVVCHWQVGWWGTVAWGGSGGVLHCKHGDDWPQVGFTYDRLTDQTLAGSHRKPNPPHPVSAQNTSIMHTHPPTSSLSHVSQMEKEANLTEIN